MSINKNVTVLTVVPLEDSDDAEENLDDLLESVRSLADDVSKLTECIKEVVEETIVETTLQSKTSTCTCFSSSTVGSTRAYAKSRGRKAPCLVDFPKDVSD